MAAQKHFRIHCGVEVTELSTTTHSLPRSAPSDTDDDDDSDYDAAAAYESDD
jgi:hypothetical protein